LRSQSSHQSTSQAPIKVETRANSTKRRADGLTGSDEETEATLMRKLRKTELEEEKISIQEKLEKMRKRV